MQIPILDGKQLDALKIVAALLMLVDHINSVFYNNELLWMELLGRLVYPAFAYVMACHFVRGVPAPSGYMSRLFLWALIAQPAFIFAFGHLDNFSLFTGNIIFTLTLAALFAETAKRLNADLAYFLSGGALALFAYNPSF